MSSFIYLGTTVLVLQIALFVGNVSADTEYRQLDSVPEKDNFKTTKQLVSKDRFFGNTQGPFFQIQTTHYQ